MSGGVKREYRSDLRSAQAEQTRRAVVDAASRLYVEHGYGGTTIDAVARAAGVSRKTVFTAVGGKLDLLKTALDWAVAGDDRPVALEDRSEMRALLALDDPVDLLAGWARILVDIDRRVGPLMTALEVAAGGDAEAAALIESSQHQRLEGARTVVRRLTALKALRPDLSRDTAVDIAWLASDAVLYDRLVRLRGWSHTRFETWLAQNLCWQLFDG
ncbi:TetR/AcrR family transcriptional regulator [Mycobacterium deserti]|uniref:TetR/AcrR family transcriptional regulator n=1 Tax=Mycobacterium deserti TaxID=2978347 RepID=A0ABT2MLR6_9MYCO|nr:TetR/AcrR family transcriptional regulator [Mycobacterium deserti]MCT7661906.1 TetR/AcrR family transcriptional regulator [Mycobacterium deserti]